MKTRTKLLIILLGLGLIFQPGCALLLIGTGAAVGVGSFAYVSGELKATEAATLERVWEVTVATTKELQFPVTSQAKDAFGGHLICRTAKDEKVVIKLKSLTNDATEVKIRVGTFGDKELSMVILEKIKKRL